MERNRSGLAEKPDGHQREGDGHEPVGLPSRQDLSDLSEVEGTGSPVEQRDSRQQHECSDRVHDREVDGTLQRRWLLDPVRRQGKRGDAHQLEEDEHVEEIARERKPNHRALEREDQRAEVLRHTAVEVVPGHDQGGGRKHGDEGRHGRRKRIDAERDPDGDAVARFPAAEPVLDRPVSGAKDEQDAQDRHRGRDGDRDEVVEAGRSELRDRGEPGGGQQREDDDQRDERGAHWAAFAQ